MKSILTQFIVVAGFTLFAAVFVTAPEVVMANALQDACTDSSSSSALCNDDTNPQTVIQTIINVLLFIVGIISVIMIIVGGIRFTLSGGDSGAVASARNTVLYAVIGLVVSLLALAIVTWVFAALQ